MKATKEQVDNILFHISKRFYYIEYPRPVDPYWWKDGDGKSHYMDDMSLDHLQASARKIENDIEFIRVRINPKDPNLPAYQIFLIEPAKKKMLELNEVLRRRVLG